MIPFLENLCKYPMWVIYLFFFFYWKGISILYESNCSNSVLVFCFPFCIFNQETSKMFILLSYWKDFVYLVLHANFLIWNKSKKQTSKQQPQKPLQCTILSDFSFSDFTH